MLVTTTFDAEPDSRHEHPHGSIWPLYLALCMGVIFIGSIFSPYFVLGGLGLAVIGLAGWGWQGSKPSGHERVATPPTCTVHAPQAPIPQPYFVPVIFSSSRSTHSRGVEGSTFTSLFFPFTLS